MKKRLTSKQKYGNGYLHTVQYDLPETKLFPLIDNVLFNNFDNTYTDLILKHEYFSKILKILSRNPYTKTEITFQISYRNQQTNEIQPLGQIRRYPLLSNLQYYENYLLTTTLNEHVVRFTFKEGFVKDPQFNVQNHLNKQICISNIWLQIEHTNPDLYKLL